MRFGAQYEVKAVANEDPVALIGCVDPVKNSCAVGPKCQAAVCDVVLFFQTWLVWLHWLQLEVPE